MNLGAGETTTTATIGAVDPNQAVVLGTVTTPFDTSELAALTQLPVAVDGVDARVQETYGGVPNSAWVIDREGTIVFRATWADAEKLGEVVDRLMRFEQSAKT